MIDSVLLAYDRLQKRINDDDNNMKQDTYINRRPNSKLRCNTLKVK